MSSPVIVIDADVLGRARTGDETYVENLLRELAALECPVRLAAVTRAPDRIPEGIEPILLPARSQTIRMAVRLPRVLRRLKPDLVHTLHVVPRPTSARRVVTVQDLSFEGVPETMGLRDRLMFKTLVPPSARRADRILVGSEWTRRDLVERYGIDGGKIVVTPYGVDPAFHANGPQPLGRGEYLLVVGGLQARKGGIYALQALSELDREVRLVFVGPTLGNETAVREAAGRYGVAHLVEVLGYVPKTQLATLYRGAACLVFPSLYEGFGLPLLEAMASGTAVVASDSTAVAEVAGEAAVLVEPRSATALADGIRRALRDRERLVRMGLAHAGGFSWKSTAERTLDVYLQLL
jgi:glycosyltransferase involved in cell wall biosynthesis